MLKFFCLLERKKSMNKYMVIIIFGLIMNNANGADVKPDNNKKTILETSKNSNVNPCKGCFFCCSDEENHYK